MSFYNDYKVKRLIKNVKNLKNIKPLTTQKYFERWNKQQKSAEDVYNLLGLPKGPFLLKSPLVWIWLDYKLWIDTDSYEKIINVLEEMFGGNDAVIAMFMHYEKVQNFGMPIKMAELREFYANKSSYNRIRLMFHGFHAKLNEVDRPPPSKVPEAQITPKEAELPGPGRLPTVKSSQQEDLCLATPFTVKWMQK
ncbi:hypothetical protein KXD40_009088 [Peronospora effusa]|nr:hypothetical protein KXD40_009088 [Peronospora effusa]